LSVTVATVRPSMLAFRVVSQGFEVYCLKRDLMAEA
jgi:hypothetical protein